MKKKTLDENEFDIFVIGGGVNGAGILRDAAGRGYKCGLADMGAVSYTHLTLPTTVRV